MKVAIIGASRGLGRSLVRLLSTHSEEIEILGISRKAPRDLLPGETFFSSDLSKDIEPMLGELEAFQPDKIFYVAGGGPFGPFPSNTWASHRWALKVSLLSAAQTAHWFMARESHQGGGPEPQFVFVGSAIAEASADAKAASYAAGKHGVLGLFQSIQAERPAQDIRLFSPGYMNTDMLPKGSWPRQQRQPLWEPDHVAALLWEWAKNPQQKGSHMSLQAFAEKPRETH